MTAAVGYIYYWNLGSTSGGTDDNNGSGLVRHAASLSGALKRAYMTNP